MNPSPSKPHRKCLIVNPNAGKKRAGERIKKFLSANGGELDIWETERRGHGRELAKQAVEQGFEMVIAAGGDGTVHEIGCGILDGDREGVRLGVLPIGSANDFAWSMRSQGLVSPAWVDVGRVATPGGKQDYFLESLGVGLSGCVTIESRKIGFLQGVFLYSLATIRALASYESIPFEVELDGTVYRDPTLLVSLLLGRREGSFVFSKDAELDDGLLDCVHAHGIGKLGAMALLPRIAIWGTPEKHAGIRRKRCQRARIRCERELVIHTDGEMYSEPGDGVREVSIEVLPKRLLVELLELK